METSLYQKLLFQILFLRYYIFKNQCYFFTFYIAVNEVGYSFKLWNSVFILLIQNDLFDYVLVDCKNIVLYDVIVLENQTIVIWQYLLLNIKEVIPSQNSSEYFQGLFKLPIACAAFGVDLADQSECIKNP